MNAPSDTPLRSVQPAPEFTSSELGSRCLVTGSCGYFGRALVARLLEHGVEVISLDLSETPPDARVRHVAADLRDYDTIRPAFEGVQSVFHGAALISTILSKNAQPALRRAVYGVNVVGTENVLRAAQEAGVQTFVHTSSFNVVMDHPIDGGDESLPYASDSHDLYTLTKVAAEKLVLAANTDTQMRTAAIRPGGIWGAGRGSMMVDAFLAELAKGAFKATIGDGKTPLDNSHVENVVDAHLLATRALRQRAEQVGGNAYFVTDDERIDAMEWFRPMVEGLGHIFPSIKVPGALMLRVAAALEFGHRVGPRGAAVPTITRRSIRNLTEGAHFNIERARRELGYVPRYGQANVQDLLPELQRFHDSLLKQAS